MGLSEPYSAEVLDLFKAEGLNAAAGNCLTLVMVLNEKQLHELPPKSWVPFTLGGRSQLILPLLADGQSYVAQLDINLLHLGETVVGETALVVIDPDVAISFSPNPYSRSEDTAALVWEAFFHAFSHDVERTCRNLERSIVANAFPADEGRVPTNHVISAAMLALNSAGPKTRSLCHGWNDISGRPTYKYEPTRGKRILVYITPPEHFGDYLIPTEVIWNIVEGLPPDLFDVALAVLAQMCEPSAGDQPRHPMLVPVSITDDAILGYRNIERNRELERSKLHGHMESLRTLTFDVDFFITESSSRGSGGYSWQGDRLFHIVRVEHIQEPLFGNEKRVSTRWEVRAGLWAGQWFSSETRLYIGMMARVLLEPGSRGSRVMAKKIGQRLLLLSQLCRPRGEVTMFIRTLLTDVGELLSPEARDQHWASRVRTNVEEGFLLLKKHGVVKAVQWPDGFGPDDIDREKGWVEPWLNARICVTTSIRPRTRSATFSGSHGQRETVLQPKGFRVTGAEIRSARNNSDPRWPQAELARHLDISRSYLSQIESGKRKLSKKLSDKLRPWLDSRVEHPRPFRADSERERPREYRRKGNAE